MTGLDLVCSELLYMIISKNWRDIHIDVYPAVYEIHAVSFERDTYALCSADYFKDGQPHNYWELVQR